MRRHAFRAGLALILGVFLVGVGAAPANAVEVANLTALRLAITGCTGTIAAPTEVELTANIDEPAEELVLPCAVTIDLGAYTLALRHIEVPSRITITSTPGTGSLIVKSTVSGEAGISAETAQVFIESGNVEVEGSFYAAGIGGDEGASGGNVNISGGTVVVRGGGGGAAIGSGACGGGGNGYTQSGGDVTVYNGAYAAAIGGGYAGYSSSVYIDGGTLHANAWGFGAAIGNGKSPEPGTFSCIPIILIGQPGTINITDGTVIVTSGADSSGIGSDQGAPGPHINIQGGSVTTSSENGTALGGKDSDIVVSGGTVVASSTHGSAVGSDGGSLTVSGGTLTASTTTGVAVGSWYTPADDGVDLVVDTGGTLVIAGTGSGSAFGGVASYGSLTVRGDLKLLTSSELSIPAGETVDNDGRILGIDGDETAGGKITGAGTVDNGGVISLDGSLVTATVTDHDYDVTFVGTATQSIRLFAPDFASGFRSIPATASGGTWNTQPDGSGTNFSSATTVTGDLTLYEVGLVASAELTPDPAATTAGTPVTFTLDARDAADDPITPAPTVVLSSSELSDVVSGMTVTPTVAGTRTITADVLVGGVIVATDSVQLTVDAAPAAALYLTSPAASVAQGGSVTFAVSAEDSYGNAASTSGVVLTSDVPTDVVSGLTVAFPHASPHVITATLGGLSAAFTVQVIPAAAGAGALGLSGSDPREPLLAGVLLLVAGAGLFGLWGVRRWAS